MELYIYIINSTKNGADELVRYKIFLVTYIDYNVV